jgi:DNA (cytosine-5)-methyltransferase 1
LEVALKSIELFAGAGGLGLGSNLAGARPQLIVERDRWCCATLRRNAALQWPEPIEDDIRSIDFRKLESNVDIVTGGPPCQPFSLGGKHKAHDDHRDMWSEAVRAVRETKPRAFVFENVKGLTRASFSAYFSYITLQLTYPDITRRDVETWADHLARLEQHHSSGARTGLQYQVIPPRVLNAADYGVPQKRERVFFIGFRDDICANWSFPKATHSHEALRQDQSERGRYWDLHSLPRRYRSLVSPLSNKAATALKPWKTVRDAFANLPDPETHPKAAARFHNHRFQPGARSYPGHTGSPIDMPAKALKAGVHGVPGGENMLVRDDGSVRYFTVRESARLQTFPDDFAIEGSWSEAMRQLGNAVPVDLARIVTASVINHLTLLDG